MQVITLRVEDEAVDKVMKLLSHFPKKEVAVIAKSSQNGAEDEKNQSDGLAGMFAPYVSEKITAEQVEEAITQSVYQRAMAGSTNLDGLFISEEERQHRQDAWNDAVANFALEGIYPSDDMKRISDLYINGKITFEEKAVLMKQSILAENV